VWKTTARNVYNIMYVYTRITLLSSFLFTLKYLQMKNDDRL